MDFYNVMRQDRKNGFRVYEHEAISIAIDEHCVQYMLCTNKIIRVLRGVDIVALKLKYSKVDHYFKFEKRASGLKQTKVGA